jgi:hypothetical protein
MKAFVAASVIAVAGPAHAEPLRLRADALATTASPAGLLVLEADGEPNEGSLAEAVVWMGGVRELGDASGDVLVATIHGKTENGRASGRLGRFVSTLGALRPVHVDGGMGRVRLPKRFDLELVAGMPVLPANTDDVMGSIADDRAWDWYVGGRASRRLGEWGAIGAAYAQRRDLGRKASEELGVDAGFTLGKRSDLGGRLAYDLVNPGVAEATITASHRRKSLRTDVYAAHRSSSHLVPATSLFSVLGDVASQRAGVLATWRAAPRLDLIADAGVRYVDEVGAELTGRARLRLDDRGVSALTGELRRSGVGADEWTGLRGAARIALPRRLTFSTELELVIQDQDHGKGSVWPWALAAISTTRGAWQTAIAVEVSASPEFTRRLDVLGQLSRRWGVGK